MAERTALRPMGLLEIVDQTFRLYRRNFWLFFGIAAIPYVPFGLLQAVSAAPGPAEYMLRATAALVMVLIYLVVSGALTKAVSDRYMGDEVTVGGAYRYVGRRVGPFALTLITAYLFVLSGLVLLIVGAIVFSFWIAFIMEVFIIEDKRYFQAIWRSRFLVGKGVWGQVVALGFITGVLSQLIQAAAALPIGLVGLSSVLGWLVNGVAFGLAGALVLPIGVVSVILLYYDSRIRKEGFDLETLARELGRTTPSVLPAAPPASPALPSGEP